MGVYTGQIEQYYTDYATRVIEEIDDKIDSRPEDFSSQQLYHMLEDIRQEYTCSARFFLMNYIQSNYKNRQVDEEHYCCFYQGKRYTFHNVTYPYAMLLPDTERNLYIAFLMSICANHTSSPTSEWKALIWKAMLRSSKLALLSREEAFLLAHGLKFSLEETEHFLLRVLDNDGFCYTRSDDLIEAFCFLYPPANDHRIARQFKDFFEEEAGTITRQAMSSKPEDFTASIAYSFPKKVERWQEDYRCSVEEHFKRWLLRQAPYLDVPSRTACTIYKHLMAYALKQTRYFSKSEDSISLEDSLSSIINNICKQSRQNLNAVDHLFDSDEDIYEISSEILNYALHEFDNLRRLSAVDSWRYLTLDSKGQICAAQIGSRIPKLLSGELFVTKADLLFIFWYVCHMYWSTQDVKKISLDQKFSDFWRLSQQLLDCALLPPFYTPHLLERSFLNALIADTVTDEYPFEIYEGMCDFVLPDKKTRNRVKLKDAKSLKISRARLEQHARDSYTSGNLDFEGMDQKLLTHYCSHFMEKKRYIFQKDGVYFTDFKMAIQNPWEVPTLFYCSRSTSSRFDSRRRDYRQEDVSAERFSFLYGLSLYLQDHCALEGHVAHFEIRYIKMASLTILD